MHRNQCVYYNIAEMAVFNVAGYLIEERRRWPVIIIIFISHMITMVHNTNSNRKKRKTKKIKK